MPRITYLPYLNCLHLTAAGFGLDDKENAVSDDNTNKDKQPHQSKLCSEKGKALTTVEVSCASMLQEHLISVCVRCQVPSSCVHTFIFRRTEEELKHSCPV